MEDKKQFHNHSFMAFCHGQIPVTSQVAELCVLCHCSNIFIINCYILSRDTFHTLGQLSVGSSVSRHFPYTCIILFKCELLSEYILHKFTVAYSYCALIQECHFPMLFLFSSDVASPWILFTNNNHIWIVPTISSWCPSCHLLLHRNNKHSYLHYSYYRFTRDHFCLIHSYIVQVLTHH